MRQWLGAVVSVVLLGGLLFLGSGHHRPDHPIPPGHQTTTTTSIPTTTTTVATSTTTAPTTTTTQATTTTVPQREQISLTADWIITSPDVRSSFDVAANGYQVVIDGTTVDWDDFSIDNAARVIFRNCAGSSEITNGLVSNSGVTGEAGAYPLHWHLNYDCTRGTVVDNVTVQNGQNHAFVPHGSHGITIRNSQALNTIDDAFWWDPPGTTRITCDADDLRRFCVDDNSNDLLWENVVVDGVVPRSGTRDVTLSGFVLGAGSGNTIRNATVSNVHEDVNCSGFHWPSTANLNEGGNVWTAENLTGPASDCYAVFVWQNDSSPHPIDRVAGSVKHGAYKNTYSYFNVESPVFEIHAGGWSIHSGHIGHLIALPQNKISPNDPTVLVENTTVDVFTVNNLDASHTNTSTYVLNNTGLTCADVVYQSVQPRTRVVVDGWEC